MLYKQHVQIIIELLNDDADNIFRFYEKKQKTKINFIKYEFLTWKFDQTLKTIQFINIFNSISKYNSTIL